MDNETRFWSRVEKSAGCWNWKTCKGTLRYPTFSVRVGEDVHVEAAYKFSYELAYGPVPDGMEIDHRCRNTACVRPGHLRACTHKQNQENRSPSMNNTSGVRGVYWNKHAQRWYARVGHNGRTYYAGTFANIRDAETAVIAKRNELFTHNDDDRGTA